ncbi:MAG TPA: toll-Interleukin receptor [Verrucomicrobiota bacterium]|nr:toll-Interleukin receptor [Verrucomicrobiota bacterium]
MRARAQRATMRNFSAASLLTDQMTKQASVSQHDIFLSHAFDDKELILGVVLTLEDLGYTVYLDWRDDPSLDRKNVTVATAEKLRTRMKASKCLFYATTENASSSKWMPWELGYKDGHNTLAAILPIKESTPTSFYGQEYLGIYPYAVQQRSQAETERIWIHRAPTVYVVFEEWLAGKEPVQRE